MIKPSEFHPAATTEVDSAEITAIIQIVEARLGTGHLTVRGGRAGWRRSDVEEVAKRYRALGWVVSAGDGYDFTFSKPE